MIQAISDKLLLNDGNKMPAFGLGCYKAKGDEIYRSVLWALETGYQMIDTATRYENEKEVGKAIADASVKRESVFVVSKMWPTSYSNPQKAIEFTLKEMKLEYLDSYLLHWPSTKESLRYKAWETLLKYQEKGYIKSIGVSNFEVTHLENLIKEFGVIPVVNQIELHPWYQQKEICEYCKKHNIFITAWGPIFRGHIAEVPLMNELALKYRKSPVQVTLRWHIQKENIVIPKSSNQERIQQNTQLFDFSIDKEDMEKIDALNCGKHFGDDPKLYDGEDFQCEK